MSLKICKIELKSEIEKKIIEKLGQNHPLAVKVQVLCQTLENGKKIHEIPDVSMLFFINLSAKERIGMTCVNKEFHKVSENPQLQAPLLMDRSIPVEKKLEIAKLAGNAAEQLSLEMPISNEKLRLHLEDPVPTIDQVKAFVESCKNLKEIYYSPFIKKEVKDYLETLNIELIPIFDLNEVFKSFDVNQMLLSLPPSVTSLNLSHCNLTDEAIHSLPLHLTSFDLTGCSALQHLQNLETERETEEESESTEEDSRCIIS